MKLNKPLGGAVGALTIVWIGDVMATAVKKKLSENDVRAIVTLLEVWDGRLTWELLVEKAEKVLGLSYSRQTYDGHETIKTSFQARKNNNRVILASIAAGKPASDDLPSELALALQRTEAAELRVQVQAELIDRYRLRFAVWLYNARNFGITVEKLNRPLPASNQEQGAVRKRSR